MEWLLQKAIDSAAQSYSPQQVAEILNSHTNAINTLDNKLTITFFLLLLIIVAVEILNAFVIRSIDRRLKKLEKGTKTDNIAA